MTKFWFFGSSLLHFCTIHNILRSFSFIISPQSTQIQGNEAIILNIDITLD